jgi:hypothetical protein
VSALPLSGLRLDPGSRYSFSPSRTRSGIQAGVEGLDTDRLTAIRGRLRQYGYKHRFLLMLFSASLPFSKLRTVCYNTQWQPGERCPSGLWYRSRKAASGFRSAGSNPALSASRKLLGCLFPLLWRGAGVADQARLESVCSRKVTVGSNPTLSAMLAVISVASIISSAFLIRLFFFLMDYLHVSQFFQVC